MGNQNSQETDRVVEEYKSRYNAKTLPVCVTCGMNDQVIPCIYGKLNADNCIYASAGYAELRGCKVFPDSPVAKCKRCNLYIQKPGEGKKLQT